MALGDVVGKIYYTMCRELFSFISNVKIIKASVKLARV